MVRASAKAQSRGDQQAIKTMSRPDNTPEWSGHGIIVFNARITAGVYRSDVLKKAID